MKMLWFDKYSSVWRSGLFTSLSIAIVISGAVLLNGCSTDPSVSADGQPPAANPPQNGAPTPEMVNTENPTLLAEDEEIPPEVLNQKKSRLEELKENAAEKDAPAGPTAGNVKPLSRPAPDNSVYTISLTDIAREIRQFKGHRVLDRVERVNDGKTTRTTAYLQTGKTLNIPNDRIKNLATASAADLMVAAGLPPPPTPTPAVGPSISNPEKDAIRRKKMEEQPIFPRRRPQ